MSKTFKNSCKPNRNKKNVWSSNQRDQEFQKQFGNNGTKSDECFECHGKGHQAWECATKFNKLRKANQTNRSMHTTLSDDEDDSQSHEEKEVVALVASYMLHESSNSKEE